MKVAGHVVFSGSAVVVVVASLPKEVFAPRRGIVNWRERYSGSTTNNNTEKTVIGMRNGLCVVIMENCVLIAVGMSRNFVALKMPVASLRHCTSRYTTTTILFGREIHDIDLVLERRLPLIHAGSEG